MKLSLLLVSILVAFVSHEAYSVPYDNDKVLRISVKDKTEWSTVEDILNSYIPVKEQDIWKYPTYTKPAYVRIPQKYLQPVVQNLYRAGLRFNFAVENVQRLINSEINGNEVKKATRGPHSRNVVGEFARYGEIVAWMNNITQLYPEIASMFTIGTTYEGRSMDGLKLGIASAENKWQVWLDAGMHAREWIAPSTAIFVTDQLVQGYAKGDPEVMEYLQYFDFHILPVANPDGYEHTHTDDRLWRKNRVPVDNGCIGVDLNRNFGYQWGGANSDTDPCSNMYLGPSPESEIEVQSIVNYILPQAAKFIMYLSYHSWGEQFFTRWDYTGDEVPLDHEELLDLAWRAVAAINATHGENYEAGIAPEIMYPFAGSSSDWSRGAAQIKYPYLLELRDDEGNYSFVPPVSEIIPCGEENWNGVRVLLQEIVTLYGSNPPKY